MFNVTGLASSLLSWSNSTDNRSSYSTGTYVAVAAITIAIVAVGIRVLKQAMVSQGSHGNGASRSLGERRISVSGPVDTKHVDTKHSNSKQEQAGLELFCKLTSLQKKDLKLLSSLGPRPNFPWFVALRLKEREVLIMADCHGLELFQMFKRSLVAAGVKKKAVVFLEGMPRSTLQEEAQYSRVFNAKQPGYLFGLEDKWDVCVLQQCYAEIAAIETSNMLDVDVRGQAILRILDVVQALLKLPKGYKVMLAQKDRLPIVQNLMEQVRLEKNIEKGLVNFHRMVPNTLQTITDFKNLLRAVGRGLLDSGIELEDGHKKLIRNAFAEQATMQDFDAAGDEITLKLRNQTWTSMINETLPQLPKGVPAVLVVGYEHVDGLVPMLGKLSN